MKPYCIFPGTAECRRLLVHVTFGNKDVGPLLNLPREASCGLTMCTHTQQLMHTHSLQTQSGTGTSTQPHSFQLSAGLHLPLVPGAWASAAWTQSRSLSRRALCLGTQRRAKLGWGDGLRDCTALTWSREMLAQEGEPRGTHAPSRQTVLGARCPKIAMTRPLESLPLLGYTTGISALRVTYRQVCSCVQ